MDPATEMFAASVLDKLTDDVARDLLRDILKDHKNPKALLGTLRSVAEGGRGRYYGWQRVTNGFIDMLATGGAFAPAIVESYAGRMQDEVPIVATPLYRLSEKWADVIRRYKLDEATSETAKGLWDNMIAEGVFRLECTEEAWRQLGAIDPTGDYRKCTTANQKIAHIISRIAKYGTNVFE